MRQTDGSDRWTDRQTDRTKPYLTLVRVSWRRLVLLGLSCFVENIIIYNSFIGSNLSTSHTIQSCQIHGWLKERQLLDR